MKLGFRRMYTLVCQTVASCSIRVLVFVALLGSSIIAHAQFEIPFKNYSIKNGLVQNQVQDIFQDSKGYIWFATVGGVSRFDGKQFKNFSASDGMPTNNIISMLEDNDGNIWMYTAGGEIAIYNGRTFKVLTKDDGLPSNRITSGGVLRKRMLKDRQGRIWSRSDSGIAMIVGDKVTTYDTDSVLTHGTITSMAEDLQGRIWCSTENGISVIDNGKITNYTRQDGLPESIISDIAIEKNGNIWIVCQNDYLLKYNPEQNNFISFRPQHECEFTTVDVDASGKIWLGSFQGLYIFDGKNFTSMFGKELKGQAITHILNDRNGYTWYIPLQNGIYLNRNDILSHYSVEHGLVDGSVNTIFEDSEGNIWIGTQNGISMYGKVIFETLTTQTGLPDNNILSVEGDANGNVWGSTLNTGITKITGQQIETFASPISNSYRQGYNSVNVIRAEKDRLWLGFMGAGLGWFYNGKYSYSNTPFLSDRNFIYGILYVNDQDYWCATADGIVHVYQNKVERYLETTEVNDVVRDRNGKIWAATQSGLFKFDGDSITNYTVENGIPNNFCYDIAIDKHNNIWLATEDGLCKITESGDQLEFKTYTVKEGLASNTIWFVHANQSDKLWLGLSNGLNTIDLTTDSITFYGEEDGYLPLECYQGAAATDIYGNVWFGTVNGLVKYNPTADKKRSTPPRTYITNISLLGNDDILEYAEGIDSKTGLPEKLVLPHNKNNIRIEWIGIHFTIPSKNRYRYFLKGFDTQWHEESVETYREYPLSPGKYTFSVMACNNDGVWNTEPVTYSFEVKPPWWASIVAFISYIILLVVLIWLYVRMRERALKEKNRQLEEKIKERTAEIEEQKKDIEEINKSLQQYQEELIVQRDMASQQRDEIAAQRKEIMDSIFYAKKIQTAIMPQPQQMDDILPQHFIFFRPRDIVSGDYYWATKKGNTAIVVAADCTGHGVPGAFMSMLGISILNEMALRQEIVQASDILNQLRETLKIILSQTGKSGEQKDGMDMSLCIIDYEQMTLQYAGAYNPLYLVRKGDLTEYKADKMPVGIHIGEELPFSNHNISLKKNDMLYIFSDGYIDQFGGEFDSKFKTKPFKQLLIDVSPLNMENQREMIVTTHDSWKGHRDQVDDILIIGIRV